MRAIAGAFAALLLGACSIDSIPFRCNSDAECKDGASSGTCEANGYCSFSDEDCLETKRRYATASPSNVAGHCVPSCVTKVSAGGSHTCAIVRDGRIACWGNAIDGQLGNGTTATANYPTPVLVDSLVSPALDVSAGYQHSCALRSPEGSVWCWGANDALQLGVPDKDVSGPVEVARLNDDPAVEIAAGAGHTCARGSWGVACWGANGKGQVGNGTVTLYPLKPGPVLLGAPILDVKQISTGAGHSCARQDGPQGFRCWGDNEAGQVIPTASKQDPLPTPLVVKAINFPSDAAAGAAHTCAIVDRDVRCWGANLVAGGFIDFQLVDLKGPAKSVTAGAGSSCVLLDDGRVECWGLNMSGQLGPNAPPNKDRSDPVIVDFESPIASVECGNLHCCALAENGKLWCWGANDQGQLGNGETEAAHAEPDSSVWKTLCE